MWPILAILLALPTSPPGLAERLRDEAVAAAAQQVHGGSGYQFQVTGVSPLPSQAGPDTTVVFSHLSKREPTGRFFAAFRLLQSGRLIGTARVDLEGRWHGQVLAARHGLGRKTIPEEADLEPQPFEGVPPAGALTFWPEGHRLRQSVPMGKILTRADLEPIPLIQPGERVRLTLRWGPLVIATDALARSQGVKGDKVRVELPSRKLLLAEILGPGEAQIEWSR